MAVRIESQAEPLPGYKLIERLGGGGFGEVWKCEAPGGLHKAIKFVFGDLSVASADDHRAEQELKALSRVKTVRHPYILSLERYDILDGQLMIVMELADRNLWDRFKECRARGLPGVPREELLSYMEETAEALDLMNGEYQLQHLDIKPQNLFLVYHHIKVADFGLVKDLEGMKASVTGGVTPVYAAPETFDGWVSRYCDQYSLAIVYQELLTGQRPFNGTNIRQLILQHLQTPPNVSPLPPADQPIIARALSKTPGDRFPTCTEMVVALKMGDNGGAVRPSERGALPPHLSPPPQGGREFPLSPSPLVGEGWGGGEPQSPGTVRLDLQPPSVPSEDLATASLRGSRSTDSNPGTTNPIRNLDGAILAKNGEQRQAPSEINGDGVLFPALVIGLGQLGMTVVQRLRCYLHQRFGGLDRLPQLRFMVLDTDPEIVRAATRGEDGARLSETDVLLAPLNRPSHYLKPRDGRPEIGSWLNPRMLYRIPRSQMTTGVRALGRLAFCDNYRLIARRLETELQGCLDPQALESAASKTGLGLRTNRVRIYLVTNLSGGTGSGMVLDLAYTVRALLKQLGYTQPDVVGLFLLPNVDGNRTRVQTLGNACAALRELRYFARPGTVFSAKYHQREPALQDSEPPFSRLILLPLPEETNEPATRQTVEEAGLFLARDMCSPFGPVADLGRGGLTGTPWDSRGLFYHTFGLYRLSWPRHEIRHQLAGRLCHRLIQRWVSKDSKPIRESVRAWIEEQWTQQQLGATALMERLGEMTQQVLGQPPEESIRAILEPWTASAPPARGKSDAMPPPEEIAQLLEQIEQLLGNPHENEDAETLPKIVAALREAGNKIVQKWGQKLAELPVRLIEAPDFRLAGAEEAIRQMVATIEQVLQHHEPLARELSGRAAELYEALLARAMPSEQPAAAGKRRSGVFRKVTAGTRKSSPFTELQELLLNYAKTQYQSLLLRQAGDVFLTLRGHLADEMREINFCRVRLGELQRMLEDPEEAAPSLPSPNLGEGREGASAVVRHLYPVGCANLKETVEHFEARLTEKSLNELDVRMEAMFKKQFTALVNVCLTSGNVLKKVESAMRHTAEEFVSAELGEMNAAELFLQQHDDAARAVDEIAGFFDEAVPPLPSSAGAVPKGEQTVELCVLSTPADAAGERFRSLAAEALPDVEWHTASGDEDILLYRERSNLPLSELPQLGALAQDAYRQMSAAEHFTPHCRSDVNFDNGD